MEMQWYSVVLRCTECKGKTSIQNATFSADGELCFTFHCGKCKEQLHWRIFASQLTHLAQVKDIEKFLAAGKQSQKTNPTPTPTELLIAPHKARGVELTEEDRRFLHNLGVKP